MTRGEEEVAREAFQYAMLQAARRLPCCEGEGEAWGWLVACGRNHVRDVWRATARRRVRESEWAWSAEEGKAAGTEEILLAALDQAMERLGAEERALLTSKYLKGASMADLAIDHRVSVKAVESRLTRARGRLRELLLQMLREAKENG